MKTPILKPLALAIMATSLTGCLSSASDGDSGTLSLGITDAPVDSLEEVNINFTGISIKPADGDAIEIELDEAQSLDMLDLQNGNAANLLDEQDVPAGDYNWIRLKVDSTDINEMNVLTDGGKTEGLSVPSGELKLVSGLTVPQEGAADFTIDFDMRKAVINPENDGGDYKLRPALRLVDNTEVGTIEGAISAELINDACGDTSDEYDGSVYVYEGKDAELVDYNSDESPLMSAAVNYNEDESAYTYKAAFLSEGDYTIAYTCTPDDPEEEDDSMDFRGESNVSVTADETQTEDFEVSSE